MPYFDTHSHLTLCQHLTLEEHLSLCHSNEVNYILDPGLWIDDLEKRHHLLSSHPEIFLGIALAPHSIDKTDLLKEQSEIKKKIQHLLDRMEIYLQKKEKFRIKAVSEIGLDFFYTQDPQNHQAQEILFSEQLALAKTYNLPVFLHIRDAYDRIFELVKSSGIKKGAVHCFTGTKKDAKKFLDQGFYLSFSGIVTFKNALEIQSVATYTPNERILTETDSPYLAPHPLRGQKNNSSNIRYINQFLSLLKKADEEVFNKILLQNGQKLLSLTL